MMGFCRYLKIKFEKQGDESMTFLEYIDKNEWDRECEGCQKCDLCKQVQCTPESIREEICFWAIGSVQHIDSIIGSNGIDCLKIPSETLRELEEISYEFKNISRELCCNKCGRFRGVDPCEIRFDKECFIPPSEDIGEDGCFRPCKEFDGCFCEKFDKSEEKIYINYDRLCEVLKEFLCINSRFIIVLNRLMFEGFAGVAILFETLNHFMIEQIYVSRIFEKIMKSPAFQEERNVWGPDFYNVFGIGCDKYECAYIQMYFWNNISAQHVSLLENTEPGFKERIPAKTTEEFDRFRAGFNKANIDLGEYYCKKVKDCRWCQKVEAIAKDIFELNECFIAFLCELNPQSQGELLPCKTPCSFFDTREHVLNEQYYYKKILERIIAVL